MPGRSRGGRRGGGAGFLERVAFSPCYHRGINPKAAPHERILDEDTKMFFEDFGDVW